MNRWARRERERELAQHQTERAQYLAQVEVLRSVGRMPTLRDYVVYHCYEWLRGKVPMGFRQWRGRGDDGTGTQVDGSNG